jgi:hypothetical protein
MEKHERDRESETKRRSRENIYRQRDRWCSVSAAMNFWGIFWRLCFGLKHRWLPVSRRERKGKRKGTSKRYVNGICGTGHALASRSDRRPCPRFMWLIESTYPLAYHNWKNLTIMLFLIHIVMPYAWCFKEINVELLACRFSHSLPISMCYVQYALVFELSYADSTFCH